MKTEPWCQAAAQQDSPTALFSNAAVSASMSSRLSVSCSSLDSSFRILLQARAAVMQSWLWAPGGHGEDPDTLPGVMEAGTPGQHGPLVITCGPLCVNHLGHPKSTHKPFLVAGLLPWPAGVACLPTQNTGWMQGTGMAPQA